MTFTFNTRTVIVAPSFGAANACDTGATPIGANAAPNKAVQNIKGRHPYKNVYGDPNVTGLTTASLFLTPGNNSVPTLLGTFSLAANGTVTYNVTPVPEPGTYGLLAVGGLVVLALRSQFRRKQV